MSTLVAPKTELPTLTNADLQALAQDYCAGNVDGWDVLMVNDGKVIARVPWGSGTIIFKLWSNNRWRNWLRGLTKSRPMDKELHLLTYLRDRPVRVPRLLGNARDGKIVLMNTSV